MPRKAKPTSHKLGVRVRDLRAGKDARGGSKQKTAGKSIYPWVR